MSKKKYDWIKIKYGFNPNVFVCERCGKEETAPTCNQGAVVMMDKFIEKHKDCVVGKDNGVEKDD